MGELEADKVEATVNHGYNEVRHLVEFAQQADDQKAILQNAEENRRLVAYRQAKREAQREKEIEFERRHAYTVVAHNSARESHDYSMSPDARKKIDYKRCTMEEESQIWRENGALVLAKKMADNTEDALDRMHMRIGHITEVMMDAAEERNAAQRREERLKMNEENRRLAQLKRESDTFERQNYRNWAPQHLMSTMVSPRPGAPTF